MKNFHPDIEVAGVRRLRDADISECIENGQIKKKLKPIRTRLKIRHFQHTSLYYYKKRKAIVDNNNSNSTHQRKMRRKTLIQRTTIKPIDIPLNQKLGKYI